MSTAAATPDSEIRWALGELARAGIESPRADGELLLAWALGTARGRLLLVDHVDDDARARFRDAIALRCRRIPLQHITGRAPFGPVELAVGPGVFIPRPETEFLLEWAQARLRSSAVHRPVVIDLCSGSGALAIGIATAVPGARVIAVEDSDAALSWLRRNVEAQPAAVADRISVVACDVTDAAQMRSSITAKADLVISNPPYVPSDAAVSDEVRHDPPSAVFGGAEGMSVITPMAGVIATLLRPGGVVGIEHDDATSLRVVDVLTATGQFDDVAAHRDRTGRHRFVTARVRMDR